MLVRLHALLPLTPPSIRMLAPAWAALHAQFARSALLFTGAVAMADYGHNRCL